MPLAETPTPSTVFNEDAVRPHISASLDRLLAMLVDHLRERRGIVVLSGESGSGKSTALRQLTIDAAPGTAAVLVRATPQTKARELYEALLLPLGEKLADDDAPGYRVRAALAGAEIPYPALLVDDAEHLSPSAFATLVELAAPGEGYLSVTVVLATKLAGSTLLRGRTMTAASSGTLTMPPLSRREVEHFVRAHLRRAQLPLDAFPPPALDEISRRSAGNPRAVARIAGAALERALRAGRTNIILDDLRGEPGAEPKPAAPLPAAPSEAEIDKALRAIRASAGAPVPQGQVATADPVRVVIAATQGDRPSAPPSGAPVPRPAAPPPPPMPRSIRVVVAGVALASASALGLLALTYSDAIRDPLERAIVLRKPAPSREAPAERTASDAARAETPAAAEEGSGRQPASAAAAPADAPAAPALAATFAAGPSRPPPAEASPVPEPPAPDAAPADTSPVPGLAAASEPSPSASFPAAAASGVPEPPAPDTAPIQTPAAAAIAAAPEPVASESSPAEAANVIPEPPTASAKPAAPESGAARVPVVVTVDLPPPVTEAELARSVGVDAPADADAVAAASGTSPAADPAVAAPASPPADDLARLFTEAEAAIRQQLGRHEAAASATAFDGISPELRRSFEAFMRSLEPTANHTESSTPTRELFERFFAERGLVEQKSARRSE